MKNKTFLGLPILQTMPNLWSALRHALSIILFTGLGYFISAMIYGSFQGNTWKYIQSIEKYYFVQAILLFIGIVLGHFSRVLANKLFGDKFYHWFYFDRFYYPIGFLFTWLIINEVFGL